MTLLLLISIAIIAVIIFVAIKSHPVTSSQPSEPHLLDLRTTTVGERQRYYKRGFGKQLQYDELQRRAEEAGDTATLEAIRLNTYTGPLPELTNDKPRITIALGGGDSDAPIQHLQYFCIKDKGYHTSVWPKDQGVGTCLEFPIAGINYGEHVTDHLGELVAALKPDPTNPYDSNAIAIITAEGHRLGYVPKDTTSEVRLVSNLPCPCYCYIGTNGSTLFSDCYITRNK